VLQSDTKCYKVLQSDTKCYKVIQSITKCYKVLQSVTKYDRGKTELRVVENEEHDCLRNGNGDLQQIVKTLKNSGYYMYHQV
jgi:hypothetical protein